MLINRRLNCIDAASGIVTFSKRPSGAHVERVWCVFALLTLWSFPLQYYDSIYNARLPRFDLFSLRQLCYWYSVTPVHKKILYEVLCLRPTQTFQLLITMEYDFDFGSGFAGSSQIFSCFRTIPVNNTMGWSAVVSCKEGLIQLHETQCSVAFYLAKAVRIFDSRLVTNWKSNKRQSVNSVPQQATTWDKGPPTTLLRPRLLSWVTISTILWEIRIFYHRKPKTAFCYITDTNYTSFCRLSGFPGVNMWAGSQQTYPI